MDMETTVDKADEGMKKTMIKLMAGLFGIFFGLIYLAGSVAGG